MAFNSQFLKIRYLDPQSHISQVKSEFKLPANSVFYPNLRLSNLGLSGPDNEMSAAGVYGLIKHIHLYSDNQLIDTMRNVSRYMDWKERTHSNRQNKNINKYLHRNLQAPELGNNQRLEYLRPQNGIDAEGNPIDCGLIELSTIFGSLSGGLKVIDTSKLKNVRVVVEWQNDARMYLQSTTGDVYTNVQPILILDEIVNKDIAVALSNEQENFVFQSIESDTIVVPSVSPLPADNGSVQSQSVVQKVRGFQGKVINRMLCLKYYNNLNLNFEANEQIGRGAYRSPVQLDEEINFNINNVPVWSQNLKNDVVKLQMLEDTYGELSFMPYEAVLSKGLDSITDENNLIGTFHSNQMLGMSSYLGCKVLKRCNDLEIVYKRNVIADTTANVKRYSEAINVQLYAEVQKIMKFDKNGITVSYL